VFCAYKSYAVVLQLFTISLRQMQVNAIIGFGNYDSYEA